MLALLGLQLPGLGFAFEDSLAVTVHLQFNNDNLKKTKYYTLDIKAWSPRIYMTYDVFVYRIE